jgi:hypothetical protein
MRYLGTDFLYNLDEANTIKEYHTDNGFQIYLLFPMGENERNENCKLAISREQLYRRYRIHYDEIEFDVFEVDFTINYQIDGENVIVDDEMRVRNSLFNFAHSTHSLLASFGGSIIGENANNRNRIMELLNADRNAVLMPPRENEMETQVFSISLSYDRRYVIRDGRGNTIFSFNNRNNATDVFRLLKNMIVRLIVSVRRQ